MVPHKIQVLYWIFFRGTVVSFTSHDRDFNGAVAQGLRCSANWPYGRATFDREHWLAKMGKIPTIRRGCLILVVGLHASLESMKVLESVRRLTLKHFCACPLKVGFGYSVFWMQTMCAQECNNFQFTHSKPIKGDDVQFAVDPSFMDWGNSYSVSSYYELPFLTFQVRHTLCSIRPLKDGSWLLLRHFMTVNQAQLTWYSSILAIAIPSDLLFASSFILPILLSIFLKNVNGLISRFRQTLMRTFKKEEEEEEGSMILLSICL